MRRISTLAIGLLVAIGLAPAGQAATVKTVTATLSPTSSVVVGVSRAYDAAFETQGIKPGAFALVLPRSAGKPTSVTVTAPGCRPSKALVAKVIDRWTISGLLAGCPKGADFRLRFATAFSSAGSATIGWTVTQDLSLSNTRSGTLPAITVTAHSPLAAMPRGQVYSATSDLASPRDGVPLLAGSDANDFRLTWTSPRAVTDPAAAAYGATPVLSFTLLPGFTDSRGYEIGGTCQVGDPEVSRVGGAKVVTFTDPVCAAGDTVVLKLIGVGSLAVGPHQFRAVLSEYRAIPETAPFPPDEVAVATVQAISPAHQLVISEAPAPDGDSYKRSITVTVLDAQGAVDTGYGGAVQFERTRCGIPGIGGPGGPWPTYQVVDGRATFTITSYDLGKSFETASGELVISPRSTDAWIARLEDGTALMAYVSPELGPADQPSIAMGDGYECPTRSGF